MGGRRDFKSVTLSLGFWHHDISGFCSVPSLECGRFRSQPTLGAAFEPCGAPLAFAHIGCSC